MAENIKRKNDSSVATPSSESENQTQTNPSITLDWNLLLQRVTADVQRNLSDSLKKELKKQIEENSKKMKDHFEKRLQKALADAKDKFRQETESSRIGIIETLAIFVALFTFVSVNISIYNRIEYLAGAIWFMILMALAMLVFLSVLLIFLHRQHTNLRLWIIPLIGFGIMLGLLIFGLKFEKLNPRINFLPERVEQINKSELTPTDSPQGLKSDKTQKPFSDTDQSAKTPGNR